METDFQARMDVIADDSANYGMTRFGHVQIEVFKAVPYGYDNASVIISCQVNGEPNAKPYAWEISVHVAGGNASLYEAQAIVKGLTPLHRKLDRLAETAGQPATFGAFVQRALTALKVRHVRTFPEPRMARDLPVTGIERHIDSAIDRLVERLIEIDAKDSTRNYRAS